MVMAKIYFQRKNIGNFRATSTDGKSMLPSCADVRLSRMCSGLAGWKEEAAGGRGGPPTAGTAISVGPHTVTSVPRQIAGPSGSNSHFSVAFLEITCHSHLLLWEVISRRTQQG